LHNLDSAVAGDQPASAGGLQGRPEVAEERSFVGAAGEQQAGLGQVAQALDDRFVRRSACPRVNLRFALSVTRNPPSESVGLPECCKTLTTSVWAVLSDRHRA
jgi:hypothetical protein